MVQSVVDAGAAGLTPGLPWPDPLLSDPLQAEFDPAVRTPDPGLAELTAYLSEHPERRDQVESALLAQARFSDIHQLAQASAAGGAQARAVPEARVRSFMAGHDRRMTEMRELGGQLDEVGAIMEHKRRHELTPSGGRAYDRLLPRVSAEFTGAVTEYQLRENLAQAIRASDRPDGQRGQDPRVVQAFGALDAHLRRTTTTTAEVREFRRQADSLSAYGLAEWTRYRSVGGPAFPLRPPTDNAHRISTSPALEYMERSAQLSQSERDIIIRVAENEGRLDSVQAYDSEIASLGVMQKTINSSGQGELPQQVWRFRQDHPQHYQRLFADRGWTVERTGQGDGPGDFTIYYQDRDVHNGPRMTGQQLEGYIKDRAQPDRYNRALQPLQAAGRDPWFQLQQIADYRSRLHQALAQQPTGAYQHPISAYLTSQQGAALVLDQSVNRPGLVRGSFGAALNSFYAANPRADRNPNNWTAEQRVAYESQILANYQAQRLASSMTQPGERNARIAGNGSPLSAAPGTSGVR